MSVTHIPADMRRVVVARAEGLCEYCLIAEVDTGFGCQFDHVISEKHGGTTTLGNLAQACVACNVAKGSDVGSIHSETGDFCRFFNPRSDRWSDHFVLRDYRIEALTLIGTVTVRIFQFNAVERLLERQALTLAHRYPNESARRRIGT
jgi:hypothetical protein